MIVAVVCLGLFLLVAPFHRASAQDATPLYVPDVPPKAALIQLSTPDAKGDLVVTGLPGAVPGGSTVALATLETGHVALVQASPSGGFTTPLFAPPGSAILIKADPDGRATHSFATAIAADTEALTAALAPVPGTIVRVPDPPATGPGIPFAGSNRVSFFNPLPVFTMQGTASTQSLQPGETLAVQGSLSIISPALQGASAMRVGLVLGLEPRTGPDGSGRLVHSIMASTFLTPTGLAFERLPRFNDFPGLGAFVQLDLGRPAPDRASVSFSMSLKIPPDLPSGYYRPWVSPNFSGVPDEMPPTGRMVELVNQRTSGHRVYLPIIRIGSPASPRLYATLLADTVSNGVRGVVAVEDRGRFGLAFRPPTQSDVFVVPRLDATTGQTLIYRLEPFAPTVSLARQFLPNPPTIPFRFPSGSLTIQIRKPDGSSTSVGPATFAQARVKSPSRPDGLLLDSGPHPTDVYELSTLDPRFGIQFDQDGLHVITVDSTIEDVWGNVWSTGGTYEIYVGRVLSLDTAVLPGTPFETGDALSPGVVISPPVPAEVEVRLRLAPGSRASDMIERVVRGRANRFGYFKPLTGAIPLGQPGEYRVDVTASFRDEQGGLWKGSRTWGGVVAAPNPAIIAHGRRGLEKETQIGLQWFFRSQTQFPTPDRDHMFIPFHAGDINWAHATDSAFPMITIQDLSGSIVPLLRARAVNNGLYFYPSSPPGTFEERAVVGEIPLVSGRLDGVEPAIDPSRVDLWAYSYRSAQRPLVRVREEISEDSIQGVYWSFHNEYMRQIGVGPNGDLPNDFKFLYGGAVVRGPAVGQPQYAVYGALWVRLPDSEPAGNSRTFPPFQGNGGGPSGGPIMTLKGRAIDLFMHLTGVRPGSVLEVGDTFAVSGAVGPPRPALVSYTITKPTGQQLAFSGRANRVGYYYHPEHDFVVDEPGLWTVDVGVTYDGLTSAGQVTPPFPTGDVLGTASGRIVIYVVPRGSALLNVPLARDAFLTPPAQVDVAATAPGGLTVNRSHVTALMPGFVLESRDLAPGGSFAYRYDPVALAHDFPNLDVRLQGQPTAADLITLSLFGSGPQGQAARVLALHGRELLNLPPPGSLAPQIAITTDRIGYQRSQPLTMSVHFSQPTPPQAADLYLGLVRPGGTFDSILIDADGLHFVPTGSVPSPIVQNAPITMDFSAPLAVRPWSAADPVGTYFAFGVLVKPGQSAFDSNNWLGLGYEIVTLNP